MLWQHPNEHFISQVVDTDMSIFINSCLFHAIIFICLLADRYPELSASLPDVTLLLNLEDQVSLLSDGSYSSEVNGKSCSRPYFSSI
jgi:hypothetical protein